MNVPIAVNVMCVLYKKQTNKQKKQRNKKTIKIQKTRKQLKYYVQNISTNLKKQTYKSDLATHVINTKHDSRTLTT